MNLLDQDKEINKEQMSMQRSRTTTPMTRARSTSLKSPSTSLDERAPQFNIINVEEVETISLGIADEEAKQPSFISSSNLILADETGKNEL